MLYDKPREIFCRNDVRVDRVRAQKRDFTLLDHGLEHFDDVVEVTRRTVNDICDAALLEFLLKEVFRVYHRNIGCRVCLNNRDINEVLNSRFLCLVKQIQIALIIDVVVADSSRTFGKSYGSDNGISAVAHAL